MATTPLKTATRALSIAIVMVAGFAGWLLNTQGLPSRRNLARSAATPLDVSFAAVAEAVPADRSTIVNSSSNSRPVSDIAHSKPAALSHDDERKEPAPLANSVNVRKTTEHPQPRIQPEVARVSGREVDTLERLAREALDQSDLGTNTNRQPRSVPTKRPPAAVFRLAEPIAESEASRMNARLAAMQRKLELMAQAQTEQKATDQQRAIELLQQIQQQKKADELEKLLQQIQEQNGADPTKAVDVNQLLDAAKLLDVKKEPAKDAAKGNANPEPPAAEDNGSRKPGFIRVEPSNAQNDRFDNIEFDDVDISKALAMLGQLSGMNILIGRGVTGRVPAANLQNVTAEQALDAITKSMGYVYERDENFVFVWTATEALGRKQAARKSVSKVYRPRYVSVKELQTLITPLLSKPGGLIAVTRPSEIGLEESRTKVGGDSLSQYDALLVVDFPEVLAQIDLIIEDIDVPPSQVVIEAMIINVELTDSMKLGVNFALLNQNNKQLVTSGSGADIANSTGFPNATTLIPAAAKFTADTAGLKYGFLTGDLSGFIEALETLAETSVVASPSVRVLNKQRAELIIGKRLGYKTVTFNGTQSVENINFLEVGTKLLIRPFVTQDGLVRMEIHPELSDGSIDGTTKLPNSTTTEVTSNVMVRDGTTIVIGGLIKEQAIQSQQRIPGLGALPVVGNLFKSKDNQTIRTELIVLITPRVIHDPVSESEGDLARTENERRHQEFREKLSPISRHNLARVEYERAARYFEEGDVARAKRHIDEALRHNVLDHDSLRLRDQITAALNDKNWWKKMRRKPPTPQHNLPSAPSSLPNGEAIFENDVPLQPPATPALVPPVPAATPKDPLVPPEPSTDNATAKRSK